MVPWHGHSEDVGEHLRHGSCESCCRKDSALESTKPVQSVWLTKTAHSVMNIQAKAMSRTWEKMGGFCGAHHTGQRVSAPWEPAQLGDKKQHYQEREKLCRTNAYISLQRSCWSGYWPQSKSNVKKKTLVQQATVGLIKQLCHLFQLEFHWYVFTVN